jgi:hypothetical protein
VLQPIMASAGLLEASGNTKATWDGASRAGGTGSKRLGASGPCTDELSFNEKSLPPQHGPSWIEAGRRDQGPNFARNSGGSGIFRRAGGNRVDSPTPEGFPDTFRSIEGVEEWSPGGR